MYQPFPGLGNCREICQENSGCTWDVLGWHMPSTLCISLQCPCNVPARYTAPCPQCQSKQEHRPSYREVLGKASCLGHCPSPWLYHGGEPPSTEQSIQRPDPWVNSRTMHLDPNVGKSARRFQSGLSLSTYD